MKTPEYLKPGDKIALVAPARFVEPEELTVSKQIFESAGLEVVEPDNFFNKHNQFSGTDSERADDFQKLLDDSSIKAIFCARGGYGSVRTLQSLTFDKFIKNPKWIVGFSDITVFHSYINTKLGVETLHAPMPFSVGKPDADKESFQYTIDWLFGKPRNYVFSNHPLNCEGKAKGRLVGGNLSVLYSLRGTPADIDTHNKILFIEDLDEYLYHIDRMMMNFKYGEKLNSLRGLVVGGMNDMKDNAVPFGKDAYQIISSIVSDLNIPVCFGFPAGHEKVNWPLALGSEVVLDVSSNCKLQFIK